MDIEARVWVRGEAEMRQHAGIELVPEDVLSSLAREHLDGLHAVYLKPDIPEKMRLRARRAHAAHLYDTESIVVLYDDTVMGSGEDGFIATTAQLCWKRLMEHPRRIFWDELAHAPIYALEWRVEIARGDVDAPRTKGGGDGASQLRAFLVACARTTQAGRAPYREAARERDAQTLAEAIVRRARRVLGELPWVHYWPSIPARMARTVRMVHLGHLAADEEILVLYDDTVFGSGSDGIVVTERGICWRSYWGAAQAIAWSEIDVERITSDGDLLFITEHQPMDLRMRPGMARMVAGALEELARVAQPTAACSRDV